MSCIQHGLSNKCVCENCNKTMGCHNDINKWNKSVQEIDFNHILKKVQSDKSTRRSMSCDICNKPNEQYKKSFYEPPRYYENGQEFNYPYKFRNQNNMWFHNEGGDFGGHSLYENPNICPRGSQINKK